MSGVFGKRPKIETPQQMEPPATEVRTTEVRKSVYAQLAKRRKATVMSKLSEEPAVLRNKLGGGAQMM